VWKNKQREAMKGGEEHTYIKATGVVYGLTIAIREIGILLKIELA